MRVGGGDVSVRGGDEVTGCFICTDTALDCLVFNFLLFFLQSKKHNDKREGVQGGRGGEVEKKGGEIT